MKIHYFQRYHSKENVDTANAMLLLSRLYTFSSGKFFDLLKSYILPEKAEAELVFSLQEKSKNSIPDATITQASFKVVVETKLYGQFTKDQLINHLNSFGDEEYKVLLTLDPNPMDEVFKNEFDHILLEYNTTQQKPVYHRHITFENLLQYIRSVIDDRDYEMIDVVDDYEEYCYSTSLIPNSWKRMRVQLAGVTLEINKQLNLYYDSVNRGFSDHAYLGLYNQKSVRAIGKVTDIIVAERRGDRLIYKTESGTLTDEMKNRITFAIEDARRYGYDLNNQRYFFVDNFIETDFKKITPRAPMGSRMFDLTEILGVDKLPEIDEIAERLKQKTWN